MRKPADHVIERVVDLTAPESNLIYNMSVADARGLLFEGRPSLCFKY
jgi:hypothetical protein